MYEVEVKVRAAHAPVRDRLTDLDAESLGTVEQVDTYYDAPHRDFAATDEALRLRAETGEDGTETRVTYKGPLVDAQSKTRREAETAVGDRAEMEAILDGLGFAPAATVEKERERFALDGYTVTLDSVAGLGAFVEVEREVDDSADAPDAGTEAADVESAREGAFDVLRRLGLDPDDQLRTSYLGLLLE
jgi:adenylate cyclase class 2